MPTLGYTRAEQSRAEQSRPDQTRPDQTRPDQTSLMVEGLGLAYVRLDEAGVALDRAIGVLCCLRVLAELEQCLRGRERYYILY